MQFATHVNVITNHPLAGGRAIGNRNAIAIAIATDYLQPLKPVV